MHTMHKNIRNISHIYVLYLFIKKIQSSNLSLVHFSQVQFSLLHTT